jgi:hypothetical protein
MVDDDALPPEPILPAGAGSRRPWTAPRVITSERMDQGVRGVGTIISFTFDGHGFSSRGTGTRAS